MNKFRFVLDSNVILGAALFKRSIAKRAFDKAVREGQIITSAPIIEELTDIFGRSRFERYLSAKSRTAFLKDFLAATELVNITESVTVCRDPKDDKFLNLALSGQAASIVTNDKDLLVLHPFREIEILTPLDFLDCSINFLSHKESTNVTVHGYFGDRR